MSRIRVVFQPDAEPPSGDILVRQDEPIPTEAICEHGRAVYDCDACLAALTAPEPEGPESSDECAVCGFAPCQCAKIEHREAGTFRGEARDANGTLVCRCGKTGRFFAHREDTHYEGLCDECFEKLLPSAQAIQSGRLESLLAKYSFPTEFAEEAK